MKDTRNIYSVFMMLLSSTMVTAQISVVPSDRDGLLNGDGMGLAQYAEWSGYPGPKHVLEFVDTLQLTDGQRDSVQGLYDEVKTSAGELGKRIVELEEELLGKFRSGISSEEDIGAASERIGKLRGQLRAVHLIAHVRTKRVLTEGQIRLYKKLRGHNNMLEHHHR